MWVGAVPKELSILTLPERILVALYFPAAYVVKLYPSGRRSSNWEQDRLNSGLKGNVSTYKLDQQMITDMISGTLEERLHMPAPPAILSATLAITFIGSNNLPQPCLRGNFRVRRGRVAQALQWLKANNPLYARITISETRLNNLPEDAVPAEIVNNVRHSTDVDQLDREHGSYIPLNDEDDALVPPNDDVSVQDDIADSDVDISLNGEADGPSEDITVDGDNEPSVIPLQALGVVDMAGNEVPDRELFSHALANTLATTPSAPNAPPWAEYAVRHGGFTNEYARVDPVTGLRFDGGPDNPNHLLGAFPWLFPYGTGGFETGQGEKVSYEAHAQWAMLYADRRFRKDILFVFQVFGVLQKREVCRAATLQIKSMSDAVHAQLRSLTVDDLVKAAEEEARNLPFSNAAIRTLRRNMTAVRARVTGTDESRQSIRGKVWGTNLRFNNPWIWSTLNPSDTHDPIAQTLVGEEIDLDTFCNTTGPDARKRATNIAGDPFAAAQFFHFYIGLVLEVLFGIKADSQKIHRKKGILGTVQAYVGTVEAQGRGTLHLHLLIWLKNAPSPSKCREALMTEEFRDRVRQFIRQNIVADLDGKDTADVFAMPTDKEAAYSRPVDPRSPAFASESLTKTRILARSLQYHQCRDRVCRVLKRGKVVCKRGAPFALARDAWVSETGLWGPKRLCAFLNAWHPILLNTLRCNHDLKLITGGAATKNLTWYIVNYTSKKQGHASNGSALLAKNYAYHVQDMASWVDTQNINKRLLQRCSNALARDREFSAPEVISYLMGWGDRFESHHYVTIRWDTAMHLLLSSYPGLGSEYDLHRDYRARDATELNSANDNVQDAAYTLRFAGDTLEIKNQLKEYAHRGMDLQDESFYRFMLDTYDAESPATANTTSENTHQAPRRGRPRHDRIPYLESFENIQWYYDCADHANAVADEQHNSMTYNVPLEEDIQQDVVNARHHVQNAARDAIWATEAMLITQGAGLDVPGAYDKAEEPLPVRADPEDIDTAGHWKTLLRSITRELGERWLNVERNPELSLPRAAVVRAHDRAAVLPWTVSELRGPTQNDPEVRANETRTTPLRDRLNSEQRRAHDIIVECLQNDATDVPQDQLLLIVHGQGGTGKTTMIRAVTETLSESGLESALGKTATSGIAASAIGGNTVHTFCGIPIQVSHRDWLTRSSDKVKERRRKNLSQKRALLVDEVSMMTRGLTTNISEVAQTIRSQESVKGSNPTLPFGGLHMIFLGDFHQFPPVAAESHALYCDRPNTDTERLSIGRQIYLQFNKVVILRQQQRSRDPQWTAMLNRLRVGECTDEDMEEFQKLVLTDRRCDVPDFSAPDWKHVVLVTPRHSVRRRWNNLALIKHCAEGGHRRYIIRAEDIDKTTGELPRIDYRVAIASLKGKEKGKLEDEIEIARGMKVMVVANISTEADMANGTRGTIEDIWVDPDEPGRGWSRPDGQQSGEVDVDRTEDGAYILTKLPLVIFFRPDESTNLQFPGLKPGIIPISPSSESFQVTTASKYQTTIIRRQFALTGAYAFTDFKSQGQTLEKAIVDIATPPGGHQTPFNIYVALSRGRGRDSVRILRDFDHQLFMRHPSEELRSEIARLEGLDAATRQDRNAHQLS
ncbi:hypothetical protein MD484_g6899, partial [Candolleomyces efflorescens]